MAALTVKDIQKILHDLEIGYEVVHEGAAGKRTKYVPASLLAPVEEGLYYFVEGFAEGPTAIRRSVVLSNLRSVPADDNIWIYTENPQLAHYKITSRLAPAPQAGIHPSAVVPGGVLVGNGVYIGPFCVLADGCTIGDGAQLLGSITVNSGARIGDRTAIEPYSVIGARGMAWIWDEDGNRILQPQFGGVEIGPDCILGSNISVVRGSLTESTRIGRGTVIAHGTKIGHGSAVGAEVHMANNVSLAGNARIGDRAFLGSGCTISSHVVIGKGSIVGAGSVVSRSIPDEFVTIVGVPGRIVRERNFEKKPRGAPRPYKGASE